MRIVIAEDEAIMRDGLRSLLSALDHEVIATLADGDSLVRYIAGLGADARPDVIVADVRMPPTHTDEGLRAALAVRADHPSIGVLILSQYLGGEYAARLLALAEGQPGGIGYLLKDRVGDVTELERALATVTGGGVVVDPKVIHDLLHRTRRPVDALTARERDVLELVAGGCTNQQVSSTLHLSLGAVEKNIRNIFDKLGIAPTDGNRRVLATLAWLSASER